MDVVLKINGRDFGNRLSTYNLKYSTSYIRTVRTLDGLEHSRGRHDIPEIEFSLIPLSEDDAEADYNALKSLLFNVEYSDPNMPGRIGYAQMRLVSDLSASFGLRSVNGKRYYKRGVITIKQGA